MGSRQLGLLARSQRAKNVLVGVTTLAFSIEDEASNKIYPILLKILLVQLSIICNLWYSKLWFLLKVIPVPVELRMKAQRFRGLRETQISSALARGIPNSDLEDI